MILTDKYSNASILHYCIVKSKLVTGNVLAAELFAAIQVFDIASNLRETINTCFGCIIPHVIFTDSKSLFDSVVRLN